MCREPGGRSLTTVPTLAMRSAPHAAIERTGARHRCGGARRDPRPRRPYFLTGIDSACLCVWYERLTWASRTRACTSSHLSTARSRPREVGALVDSRASIVQRPMVSISGPAGRASPPRPHSAGHRRACPAGPVPAASGGACGSGQSVPPTPPITLPSRWPGARSERCRTRLGHAV